jgi:hypothetical protein
MSVRPPAYRQGERTDRGIAKDIHTKEKTVSKTCDSWLTVDFRPVPVAGWRVLFIEDPSGWLAYPLAGWLIEERVIVHERNYELHPDTAASGDRERRVVAAIAGDFGEAESVNLISNFWCLLGPGEPDPTADQESEARTARSAA